MFGWILVIIGIIFAILGIGSSATLKVDGKLVITGAGGIILIVVGVIFMSAGI